MFTTRHSIRRRLLTAFAGMVGLTGMAPDAPAQCQFPKLTAADGAFEDFFGRSVAISGDTAVIGALGDDDLGGASGSAYVFEKVGGVWVQTAKLTAADGTTDDFFGVSIAVSGNTAVIGASGDDDRRSDSGSAYVFEKIGKVWVQTAKLTAADGASFDGFGNSVALSGNTAVIGANLDDDRGTNSGSAYVFEKGANDIWDNGSVDQVSKLTATDGAQSDQFGASVALSGETAVIGAHLDDDRGANSGSSYVFEKFVGVWAQTTKFLPPFGAGGEQFGVSVALSGNTAVIGANRDDDRGPASGSAYVFERIGGLWARLPKLTAADGATGDEFGRSVAVSGDTAVIGANLDDDRGTNSGSAYVFEKIGGVWAQTSKLTADDGAGVDLFGFSVALSGDTAVIGAWLDDDACPFIVDCDSGSAYVFALAPINIDSDGDGVLDECDPCPLDNPDDSDADGVCNSDDLCPDTLTGVPVNECGCLEAGACCTAGGKCGEFTPDACDVFGGIYQGDGSTCAEGCAFGDLDADGDVDLADFAVFALCFTGAGGEAAPGCLRADVDGCGPIDLEDFAAFRAALTGP